MNLEDRKFAKISERKKQNMNNNAFLAFVCSFWKHIRVI